MAKSKTQKYYDSNPDAKKRKAAYDSLYHSTKERREYRSKLNKANRKAGTYGNGDDMDMSHTKSGKLVKESKSNNRARNGSSGKSTRKS
jgi:hypothetical protein